MRPFFKTALTVVLTGAVVAPLAWVAHSDVQPATATADVVRAGPELWTCPMHPTVVEDHPGNCPICGMKLVRRAAAPEKRASEVEGRSVVEVDARQQQLLGLRTAYVTRGTVDTGLRTSGRLAVDETRVRRVSMKVPGFVEKVFVDFVGKPVRRGQALFSLYSPEVFAAENEYLAARASSPALAAAVRRRLELWDVPADELARLERESVASRSVTFTSPVAGVVTRKEVFEGSRLEVGAMPYDVTDLSTLWLLADVYERELRFVSVGATAQVRLSAFPGQQFEGKVLFVDPLLDPQTRSARARIAVANPSGALRPELFGEVLLERPARDVLRVPTDTLLWNGRDAVVFRAPGQGRFEPVRVEVGESSRDFTEVLSGLQEGEQVVSRGAFLLDSESRLRASLERLEEPERR